MVLCAVICRDWMAFRKREGERDVKAERHKKKRGKEAMRERRGRWGRRKRRDKEEKDREKKKENR